MVDLNDQWVVLNVREDQLAHFAIGAQFQGRIPALKDAGPITFKVYASALLPDFATWRTTRSDQGFDVRSFEIKARPSTPVAGARPGMSVIVEL